MGIMKSMENYRESILCAGSPQLQVNSFMREHFVFLKEVNKMGISTMDVAEAWLKCGISHISLPDYHYNKPVAWGIVGGWEGGEPPGWKDRYGWFGYQISLNPNLDKIKCAKEIKEKFGFEIDPKVFIRTLWFHEVAHTEPISGLTLYEYGDLPQKERLKVEKRCWQWAIEMAKKKDPTIRVKYPERQQWLRKKMKRQAAAGRLFWAGSSSSLPKCDKKASIINVEKQAA